MTQEEKELLIKALCEMLPYGVMILHEGWNYEWDDELHAVERVVGIDEHFIYTKVVDTCNGEEYRDDKWPIDTFDDKLFLCPMSSMTEEEKNEYRHMLGATLNSEGESIMFVYEEDFSLVIDWLNAHHFDYRGLIEKGLALEAPEGMYRTE